MSMHIKFLALAVTVFTLGQSAPQLGGRLVKCDLDPLLVSLENLFHKKSYIQNQVACLTDLSLMQCTKDQFCDSCCCDAVGLKLRELAPVFIPDPDEATCVDHEEPLKCICLKRDGRRVLERLRTGQSETGESYRPFYDKVFRFYGRDPNAEVPSSRPKPRGRLPRPVG